MAAIVLYLALWAIAFATCVWRMVYHMVLLVRLLRITPIEDKVSAVPGCSILPIARALKKRASQAL